MCCVLRLQGKSLPLWQHQSCLLDEGLVTMPLFLFQGTFCLLTWLVQAWGILSQRQNFLSRGIFHRTDFFKNQHPFPLQGFPPTTCSDTSCSTWEEHWIIGSASKLRGSKMAFFVHGKVCRADGTCWELQALADNYQISLVLSSSWVWDYWLNLEWPLCNGHDEESWSWAPGQCDWADPYQVQTSQCSKDA